VALKIDDGGVRAAEAAMAAIAQALLSVDDTSYTLLGSYSGLVINNWRGTRVGALRVAPALAAALTPA
jgi:L-asparaginase II